jgi:ABC-type Fe3+/spermidine/putrescine transport system ATPase subunit
MLLILINGLKAYWKPLLIILALTLAVAYVKHLQSECVRLNEQIVIANSIATAQIEHNKEVVKAQAKVTADVVQAYSDSVNKLKDYYAKNPTIKLKPISVLPPATNSGEVSSIPNATSQVNADTTRNQSSTTEPQTVTVEDCATDVLTLLSLQKWITQQSQLN